jgi:hypothetical protein
MVLEPSSDNPMDIISHSIRSLRVRHGNYRATSSTEPGSLTHLRQAWETTRTKAKKK